jgi:hypothetical protein
LLSAAAKLRGNEVAALNDRLQKVNSAALSRNLRQPHLPASISY